ncbi:hypothetical protein DR864_00540 [Runella rosea]|uniref:Uncharacterized protein n=1 Tax=Runella rosea TaxID=2259595 RepID=A0A344TCE7_9BACT|nr:hypothetical protein DR864_00540 [Runella rosea]
MQFYEKLFDYFSLAKLFYLLRRFNYNCLKKKKAVGLPAAFAIYLTPVFLSPIFTFNFVFFVYVTPIT